MKPYLTRPVLGHHVTLVKELPEEDSELYKSFLRIDEDLFNETIAHGPVCSPIDSGQRPDSFVSSGDVRSPCDHGANQKIDH